MIIQATSIPGGTTNAFSGDIIIESGTYEINDPLYMLPGAKILVKKGARLKIYDKITAACGGMWEGIVVEGTPSGSQSKASSTNASQGWVSLYAGGEIEHARIGIRLETEDGGYGGGSILYPCMGTFTNCTTSIKFGAHLSPNANAAWILSTDFLLDGEYRGGSGQQPIFIDLLFNTMVRIQGCTFNDDRPNGCAGSDSKAIGIDAKASSVNTFSNDFENLGVGIRLNQQLFGASLMNASNYTNCYQGIETIKSSKFSINDNDFLLGIPDGCSTPGESVGVTLSGNTAGLTFSKNSFSQNSSDITIGTKVQSTMGGMNNVIFDNEYTDLDIGNIALGFNGNNNGGISYACNTHSGDEDDYIVDANATVWAQQKYVDANADDAATGNLFSGGSGKGSFNNAGGNIQYFYAGSASAMNQEHFSYNNADYSGVVGTVETSNGDCADVPPCNPCDPGSIYTGIRKADFYDKRQERNDKLTILGTLTRPTEIAAMQDSILNLKQVMDRNANLVLQSYAQDTTEAATIQMDSIFAWLERSATYAGDLELANLYFFLNKLGKFDTLWAGIPTAHSLIGDDLDELDELGLVYDLLRPTIEEEESLSQLAQPILDSLAFWQGWCSEPGFLAKSVLLWNGIESVQDCDEPQKTTERALPFSKERRIKLLASNIIIYPNPANHAINLAFGQKPKHAIISLFDAHGRLYKSQQLWIDDDGYSQVFVQDLPTGLYIIKVQADVQAPHFSKLEIIH